MDSQDKRFRTDHDLTIGVEFGLSLVSESDRCGPKTDFCPDSLALDFSLPQLMNFSHSLGFGKTILAEQAKCIRT